MSRAYRIGMLVSTAGALVSGQRLEGTALPRSSAWMWGYVTWQALVLVGHLHGTRRHRAEQSAGAEAATSGESAFARVTHAAAGACSEFLIRKMRSRRLPSWCCSNSPTHFPAPMTAPFVIDLGFSRNDYGRHRQRAWALPQP